jgi:hypothetical protein
MTTPARIDTGRHACTIGAKSLFKIINDRTPEAGEARKFFEQSKPTTQCNAVVPFKTECWLCGNGFSQTNPDFSPQCEHILPVAQGVIFLELYSSKKGTVNEAMAVEYAWAHRKCNLIKGNTVLIKGSEAKFEPDVDKIMELLNAIRRSVKIQNIEDQVASIQGVLFNVTSFINQLEDYNINLNMEVCPRKLLFKGGRKTFKRKNNGLSRRTNKHAHRKTSRSHRKL